MQLYGFPPHPVQGVQYDLNGWLTEPSNIETMHPRPSSMKT
jgi:hypothetical protein